mgnify:CR=1
MPLAQRGAPSTFDDEVTVIDDAAEAFGVDGAKYPRWLDKKVSIAKRLAALDQTQRKQ